MAEPTPNPITASNSPTDNPPSENPVNPVSPLDGGSPPPANPVTPQVTPPPPPTESENPPPEKNAQPDAVNPLDDPAEHETQPDFEVTPEKLVFPQGFDVVPEAVNEFSAFVKEQKLNVEQVNGVIDWYGKFMDKHRAAAREAEVANINAYNDAIKAIPQEDLKFARQAVERFAASQEDKAFLKKAFVAPAVLKLLAAAGRATAEHAFIQSSNPNQAYNPLAKMYQTSIQQGG